MMMTKTVDNREISSLSLETPLLADGPDNTHNHYQVVDQEKNNSLEQQQHHTTDRLPPPTVTEAFSKSHTTYRVASRAPRSTQQHHLSGPSSGITPLRLHIGIPGHFIVCRLRCHHQQRKSLLGVVAVDYPPDISVRPRTWPYSHIGGSSREGASCRRGSSNTNLGGYRSTAPSPLHALRRQVLCFAVTPYYLSLAILVPLFGWPYVIHSQWICTLIPLLCQTNDDDEYYDYDNYGIPVEGENYIPVDAGAGTLKEAFSKQKRLFLTTGQMPLHLPSRLGHFRISRSQLLVGLQ